MAKLDTITGERVSITQLSQLSWLAGSGNVSIVLDFALRVRAESIYLRALDCENKILYLTVGKGSALRGDGAYMNTALNLDTSEFSTIGDRTYPVYIHAAREMTTYLDSLM